MALSIIGAGYGRTGTASLKLALDRLGLGPTHHMSEVLPSPNRIRLWTRIGAGEADSDPGLWDEAFSGYNATVDWPAATHWRALAAHFPEAKVVLTRRDAGRWFDSVHATILKPENNAASAQSPMGPMLESNVWRLFGDRIADRAWMMQAFEQHCADVVAGVPPERLLVWEARDGWGPLCAFLGVDVPSEPFPHVNTKEETARVLEQMAAQIRGGAASASDELAEGIYRSAPGTDRSS